MIYLVTGGFYFFCAYAIYFHGRIHCNVIESTKIMIVMRLRGFFISTFSLILYSSKVIHFNPRLECMPKRPPKNTLTVLYFFIKLSYLPLNNSTYYKNLEFADVPLNFIF